MSFTCVWCGRRTSGGPPEKFWYPFDSVHCAAEYGVEAAAEVMVGGRHVPFKHEPNLLERPIFRFKDKHEAFIEETSNAVAKLSD